MSIAVATTAIFILFINPVRKSVCPVNIFSYHLRENPEGGNDIASPELNETTTIIIIGASMKVYASIVIILLNKFTLSSRIFSTS